MDDDATLYRTFKRAVWLGGGLRARSAWPILVVVLPILWELVKVLLASRVGRLRGTPEDLAAGIRVMVADLPAEGWAHAAWWQAEADVRGGRD